jgi:AraC family transcriptional regulator
MTLSLDLTRERTQRTMLNSITPADPFSVRETHRIALQHKNQLLVHSDGRGWQNLYASVAAEKPWHDTLPPIHHHCIAYCLSDSAMISRRIDGEKLRTTRLSPRLHGMIPADVSSDWRVAGSPHVLLVYIRKTLVERLAAEVFDRDPAGVEIIPGLGFRDGLLEQLVLAILSELNNNDSSNPVYVDTLANAIAIHLLKRHTSKHNGSPDNRNYEAGNLSQLHLDRVVDYIAAFLHRELTIERLANVAGMNPIYFARAFKKRLGVAPHQFVLLKRIERAKELLADSDTPIVEIALATGFSSQSHLSSLFKQIVGETPRNFRSPKNEQASC